MTRYFWHGTCLVLVVALSGCASLLELQQFDTPHQRAWEEASAKMVIKWRNLPDDLSDVEKVEAIIVVGDAYIRDYYPEHVGYLALTESLSAEYAANYLTQDGSYKPRLRFIYSLVIEYLRAEEIGEPVSYNGPKWDTLERRLTTTWQGKRGMTK